LMALLRELTELVLQEFYEDLLEWLWIL
jgi:hypothetical protein